MLGEFAYGVGYAFGCGDAGALAGQDVLGVRGGEGVVKYFTREASVGNWVSRGLNGALED
jgi:hypothetical protein